MVRYVGQAKENMFREVFDPMDCIAPLACEVNDHLELNSDGNATI